MPPVLGCDPATIADPADSLINPGITSFSYFGRNQTEPGLLFATVLTLGFVPVMYSLFFRVNFKNYSYKQ